MGLTVNFRDLFNGQKSSPITATTTHVRAFDAAIMEGEGPSNPEINTTPLITNIDECRHEIAAAMHNKTALGIITHKLDELATGGAQITKQEYSETDPDAITNLRKSLQQPTVPTSLLRRLLSRIFRKRSPTGNPPIRTIDILVLEINLGDLGNKPKQEAIDLIRETLKTNPNAIIFLVTSDPQNVAEVLPQFENYHVYYRANEEKPFNGNQQSLNDSCIKGGNLKSMLKQITELPKYKRLVSPGPNVESNSSDTSNNIEHDPHTSSSDIPINSPTSSNTSSNQILSPPNRSLRMHIQAHHINPLHTPESPKSAASTNSLGSLSSPLPPRFRKKDPPR